MEGRDERVTLPELATQAKLEEAADGAGAKPSRRRSFAHGESFCATPSPPHSNDEDVNSETGTCKATWCPDAIAKARQSMQKWSEHSQACRIQRAIASSAGKSRLSWAVSRTLRCTLSLWERATIGCNLARRHAVRQLVVRVLPALRRRIIAGYLGTLRKNASLRRARRLLVGIRIANQTRALVSEILGHWLRECAVGQRCRSAQARRIQVHGRRQGRSVPKEEFLEWADRAQRKTNRFANLLFALSCWRQAVSWQFRSASCIFQLRGSLAHEKREQARATPDSASSFSGGGAEGLGQNSHDDLPGMSDPDHSDDEHSTESSQDLLRAEVHNDVIWQRGEGWKEPQLQNGSLMTAFLSPATSELEACEDEGGVDESGRHLFDADFLQVVEDMRHVRMTEARSSTSPTHVGGFPCVSSSNFRSESGFVEQVPHPGQRDLRLAGKCGDALDQYGAGKQNEALQLSEFVSSLARFSKI